MTTMTMSRLAALPQRHSAAVAVVLVLALNLVVTPNFLSTATLWNIVIQSSTVLLVALGITLTIATGGIDLTVGSMMALTAALTAVLAPVNPVAAPLIAIAAALALGALNGILVSELRIQPLILTLAGMLMIRGLAQVVTDGRVVPVTGFVSDFAAWRLPGGVPSQLLVSVIAAGAVFFLVKRTTFGTYIEAVGDSPRAAKMAGLPTRAVLPGVYMASALLAGIAGLMQAGRLAAADPTNIGNAIHLDAIAAVAIGGANLLGGRPNVGGTILGVLLLQLIDVMLTMNNIPYAFSLVLKALIIVGAVYLQLVRRRS
ncbi:ABC transporter permease [Agromyces aerolatus]|uniref:ABC transporter permease n=1 Tax=Agromyces sp. LY-1074 TaxID=3074080 RepID=UPI002866DB84|nr:MULTISPECIES: ABC transporter permease [unclassified Agromyces]MDR5699475.1 ABC transporter permease [Agromyces sp. LY-1074]MDR5705771.1 ABC transporter permease [Agromyces sp. LY-1358]